MTTHAALRVVALLCIGGAAIVACSTSSSPLGGPHGGGSAFRLAPTDGGFLNVDATYSAPTPPAAPGMAAGTPGHWSHIFNAYLAAGTVGNCTHCHPQMSNPTKAYKYLQDDGYLDSPPLLTEMSASTLSWYGGDMPPNKPSAPDAKAEMDMWAHNGARND